MLTFSPQVIYKLDMDKTQASKSSTEMKVYFFAGMLYY